MLEEPFVHTLHVSTFLNFFARIPPIPKSLSAFALAFAFVLTRIVQTGEEPVKVALRLSSLDL